MAIMVGGGAGLVVNMVDALGGSNNLLRGQYAKIEQTIFYCKYCELYFRLSLPRPGGVTAGV